jgi:hypothetical protein
MFAALVFAAVAAALVWRHGADTLGNGFEPPPV